MYINTVDSLKDSFTPFKRVVWAYVWAFTLKNNEKGFCLHNLEFHCYISVGDDEEAILKKVNEYLQEFYKNDEYVITNIIPYKEELKRELKKEHSDVFKKILNRKYGRNIY